MNASTNPTIKIGATIDFRVTYHPSNAHRTEFFQVKVEIFGILIRMACIITTVNHGIREFLTSIPTDFFNKPIFSENECRKINVVPIHPMNISANNFFAIKFQTRTSSDVIDRVGRSTVVGSDRRKVKFPVNVNFLIRLRNNTIHSRFQLRLNSIHELHIHSSLCAKTVDLRRRFRSQYN